jgi:ribosomal protein S8
VSDDLFLKEIDFYKGKKFNETCSPPPSAPLSMIEKYFEAYFCFTIDNKIYNKDLEFFLENIKNKEQLINELNYDLTYKNGQNIGRLIEEILLHPKTAITDEKKQFIFDAFMYIGDDILRNVKLKYDGNNVKENLLALFNDFINILSLNDKDKKYEIILNSFDDKSDSLNIYAEYVDSLCNISPRHITGLISVFDINITMKNNLKNKLKDRIEEFYLSWKILDVPYLSDILEIWKVLDEEKYNKFIEEVKQDDEKLLKFVRAFLYLSFDESVNGIKKIKKDSISKYIDFEYIENSDIFNEVLEYFR